MAEFWYVGQLKPNGLALAERNLTRQGIESFCPWQVETHRCSDQLRDVRRPLFPGYIFVRLDPGAGHWRSVNSTRGLTRLVQTDPRAPTPLPEALIAGLRARCDPDGQLTTPPTFAPGDPVRVIAGPFAELVTRIESITADARIRVMFDMMQRKMTVELDPTLVRKIDSNRSA
jgi:transcriptional antiterminator RfaH